MSVLLLLTLLLFTLRLVKPKQVWPLEQENIRLNEFCFWCLLAFFFCVPKANTATNQPPRPPKPERKLIGGNRILFCFRCEKWAEQTNQDWLVPNAADYTTTVTATTITATSTKQRIDSINILTIVNVSLYDCQSLGFCGYCYIICVSSSTFPKWLHLLLPPPLLLLMKY